MIWMGAPADDTVRFGVDGSEYEIDLSIKNAAALRRKLAPFSSTMPARRDEEHAAGPAGSVKPGAQHGHPGVGERPGHRGQRARAHPRERGCAVRSRDQTTLTGAGPSGAMASFSNVADRPELAQVSAYREP